MDYEIEYLTKALKKAREDKKLSQRALSKKTGIPQAQISKIENAGVDLQTSSLLGLARALDLEVMLIPRPLVPMMSHLVKQMDSGTQEKATQRPVYSLDEDDDD